MATILVVDDLAANREVLVTLLREQGHGLIEAADGRAALVAVQANPPDLVITDVLMPVMDGYEFVRQLRLDPATSRIPVVFSTAHYGRREARALASTSGVAHILTKPVEPEEVLKVVAGILAGDAVPTAAADAGPGPEFDREHLRLTDRLSEKSEDLRIANARLRALINIGLELASEPDSDRLLRGVCAAARELFGATYVTLGIVDRHDRLVRRLDSCGIDIAKYLKPGEPAPGLLGTVIAERRTLRGDNAGADPVVLGLPAHHPPVRAYLAAPVASPVNVYGWICLAGNEGQTFTEDDEQLLLALSGQVGRIYENGYYHAVAKAERDRAKQFLDAAEVILLALDLEGRITLINRYGCAILGWTSEELRGRDWVETCLPPRIRPALKQKLANVIGGDLATVENPILTRSGEERLIEWRNTVLRDSGGTAVGALSSGTDITDRNKAVAAVRTAEERMRFALASADVGIWDLDHTTGVLTWSETIEAQYGLAPGTFGGTFEAYIERVHPEDRARLLDTMSSATTSGADFTTEHRALWPDGTVRWLSGAGRVLLDEHGAPVRAVGISLDITERRTLEAQFQQAQKMEAVGRLAGGVAHDFNNLLTVILGHCELILDDLDPQSAYRKDITEIQKAGGSAARLTKQLLAFSRKQLIEPALLDMNAALTTLRAMLGRLIGEDIRIVMRLRPEPALVTVDRGQLEQIVMNLAINARDAMPTGGVLTIETGLVDLDQHYAKTHIEVTPGQYVALTISDTGVGMTPAVQSRLFEPFFTTKEVGKGTGLGLATVHGIVKRCGGSVNVYSEPGKGASFKVYLPMAEGAAAPAEVLPPMPRERAGTHTVLVVEDAEGLRDLARKLLERQGYTVLVAANAQDAVRQFETHPAIDVLLTDVVMPGASGPELTQELVARRPLLKVVYMSGYTEEAIVRHGVIKPGIMFLHKPFTSDTLGQKIREALEP